MKESDENRVKCAKKKKSNEMKWNQQVVTKPIEPKVKTSETGPKRINNRRETNKNGGQSAITMQKRWQSDWTDMDVWNKKKYK